MAQESRRIGVDVGGTNTDAVLMQGRAIIASFKAPTTADISSGIVAAVREVLRRSNTSPRELDGVMIGTTQFTNAFVERRGLTPVGVVRLGAPATLALPPLAGWPRDLATVIGGQRYIVRGGNHFDGRPIAQLDEAELRHVARRLSEAGMRAIAVSAVFSPVDDTMERRAGQLLKAELPDAHITLSSEIGRIGLVERENAAIMNASLIELAGRVVSSFESAFAALDVHCPLFICQNDGTLLPAERAMRFPVLTYASGPTNSMRGAAFLSDRRDAIVVDIGGTTSDIGVLKHGFPRESSIAVTIGGVRTNFRMPDILSIGLGGGSLVVGQSDGAMRVGPQSVGFRIFQESLVFGGETLTATDIAIAAGHAKLGDPARTRHLPRPFVAAATAEIRRLLEEGIDRMKAEGGSAPVVLVGGGALLIAGELHGASFVESPRHAEVANAIGAAIAQVSGESDRIYTYQHTPRERALEAAHEEANNSAIVCGAVPETLRVVEVEELPLAYLPGGAVRVRVKVVGDLRLGVSQALGGSP